MYIAKPRQPFFLFVLLAIPVGSVLTSITLNLFRADTEHINTSLHSALEAFGGMAAVSMSLLVLQLHHEKKREKGEYFLLSMGFLMMGILDIFHAVSTFGHGFILIRSLSNFFSSLWFAMVWLPRLSRHIVRMKAIPWLVLFISIATGVLILKYRDYFPEMMTEGRFTPLATFINLLSGAGIFAAALYFFREFLLTSKTESYFFICMMLLLSLSSLEFPISVAWSIDWWFWHVQRCLAYTVVFYFMFKTFLRVSEDLRKSNELLETRVAERTAELLTEVAERKRYGTERDKVITELQEALNQIKVLTGLLPTCAACKKIRDTEGNWVQMESYIQSHSNARFTHGICPICAKELYPEVYDKLF